MDLAGLRKMVRALYGLKYSATEDDRYADGFLDEIINIGHNRLAAVSRCYRGETTKNLAVGSGGVSDILLGTDVIDVIENSVRVNTGGTWNYVGWHDESELRRKIGPFENLSNVTTPDYYFTRFLGATAGQHRYVTLVPGCAAVTNGFKCDTYIYPPVLSQTTDTPPLQPAEHEKILPWAIWALAEFDVSEGRADPAIIEVWRRRAEMAATELADLINRATYSGPRTVRPDPEDYD